MSAAQKTPGKPRKLSKKALAAAAAAELEARRVAERAQRSRRNQLDPRNGHMNRALTSEEETELAELKRIISEREEKERTEWFEKKVSDGLEEIAEASSIQRVYALTAYRVLAERCAALELRRKAAQAELTAIAKAAHESGFECDDKMVNLKQQIIEDMSKRSKYPPGLTEADLAALMPLWDSVPDESMHRAAGFPPRTRHEVPYSY
jgi:hypothetical protein